jgi:hypothetical protein
MCGSAVLSQTRGDPNTEADHGGKRISQGFIVGEMGNEDGRKAELREMERQEGRQLYRQVD